MLLLFPWAQSVLGNLLPAGGCLQAVSRGLSYSREPLSPSFSFNHVHARGFWIKRFTRKVRCISRKAQVIYPSDNLLKFSDLRRTFTDIWNTLTAKPDAARTSALCEEAHSYVSSHLYCCMFADLLHALCWLAHFICLNPWHRRNTPLNNHGINAEKLITLKLSSGFTWLLREREQLW